MSQKFVKAIKILKNLNQPDRVINRDRINFTKFMSILGNPYNSFRSIHITGTNGKGSVCVKIAKILQKAGYKTGVYTSPHLFTFRQRIQINGQYISRQQISEKIIYINQISQKQNLPLSYFEFVTAAGFLHFKENKCDYVSLEVGLGGKNDTTNLVNPQISIITSIGLDHVELLGPTMNHIAAEKSGIIKKQRPVVLGPTALRYDSINQAILVNNCKKFQVSPQSYNHINFDSQNNATVRQSIKALEFANPSLKISEQNISEGLSAKQPCRMQLLDQKLLPGWCKNKRIFFDVGHNPQAINKVKQYLQKLCIDKNQIHFIFGTSKGKKFNQSLSQIEKICSQIYLIQAKHFRACKIGQLQSYIAQSKYPNKYRCVADGDIKKTLQFALADLNAKTIVICGSFFIMPQSRGYFQPSLVQFPQQNINQIYQLHQKNN